MTKAESLKIWFFDLIGERIEDWYDCGYGYYKMRRGWDLPLNKQAWLDKDYK